MIVRFHRDFEKRYKKINKKTQKKVRERLELFSENLFDPCLNNHPLGGKYTDYRSINITGDLRAVYKFISQDECIFVFLGNHSNLYS